MNREKWNFRKCKEFIRPRDRRGGETRRKTKLDSSPFFFSFLFFFISPSLSSRFPNRDKSGTRNEMKKLAETESNKNSFPYRCACTMMIFTLYLPRIWKRRWEYDLCWDKVQQKKKGRKKELVEGKFEAHLGEARSQLFEYCLTLIRSQEKILRRRWITFLPPTFLSFISLSLSFSPTITLPILEHYL